MNLNLITISVRNHLLIRGDYVTLGRTLYRVVAVVGPDLFVARRAGRGELVRWELSRWVGRGRRLILGAWDRITKPLRKVS
jgi:hypothetical protein